MEFQEVVRRRRMVRRFTGEPVQQPSLDRILANAVRGPSAGFSQGQAFLVLTGPELAEFWKVTGEPDSQTAENAPLIIVPLSCKRVYLDRYALPDKGVPADYEPIGAIAVGYDAETERRDLSSRRKPLSELVHYAPGKQVSR